MSEREPQEHPLLAAVAPNAQAQSAPGGTGEQGDPVFEWATMAAYEFQRYPNHEREPFAGPDIVYGHRGNMELKLEVFTAGVKPEMRPTVMYIHGGGWVHLMKEDRILYLLPYLALGMNTVNIDYRVAYQSPAPAAVEDCRTALHWVHRNAPEYGFDLSKLVVTGESAGGNLALMTGMLNPEAGFDNACAWSVGEKPVRVAAIVNFFGPTDVTYFLEPPHTKPWAPEWFGSDPDRMELAKRVSPLTYVRPGLPPIITIHGDADRGVPHEQAVRLHEALDRVGVPNELITIPGGGHGAPSWPQAERLRAHLAVNKFLKEHNVL